MTENQSLGWFYIQHGNGNNWRVPTWMISYQVYLIYEALVKVYFCLILCPVSSAKVMNYLKYVIIVSTGMRKSISLVCIRHMIAEGFICTLCTETVDCWLVPLILCPCNLSSFIHFTWMKWKISAHALCGFTTKFCICSTWVLVCLDMSRKIVLYVRWALLSSSSDILWWLKTNIFKNWYSFSRFYIVPAIQLTTGKNLPSLPKV